MDIKLLSLLDGARSAVGTAVIIDVYRAFTTAAVAFQRGVDEILLVAEIEDALALRESGRGDLCVGEVDGKRPDGFDYNNSPFAMSEADIADKRLILSTRAGTVGVEAASNASEIYVASLMTAAATAAVIRDDSPDVVSVVAMGWATLVRTDEDEQCGLYIRNLLQGASPDPQHVASLVASASESQKFDDPAKPHFHLKDREIALRIDSAQFAIKVLREEGLLIGKPIYTAEERRSRGEEGNHI